ncbi:hypothetical protein [Streptomyces malaysiensis]|uniref:hypothetical protein n=1 Tax=Streptomyces malaysiensis TaxID=92644 RepID=UPI0008533E4B|nr:hypothetical protein [Streptomyces sp. SPMA113]
MGLRRSSSTGADSKAAKSASSALTSFTRSAGPASGWTAEQRAEHSRLVSTAQHAELDATEPKRRWFF